MFHGTYDRAVRADRYLKVAAEYTELSKGASDPHLGSYYLRIAEDYQDQSQRNCGRWSERGSARRPVARAHQRKLREDSEYPMKEKPGAAHLQPAYSPGDEAFPGEPLLMAAFARRRRRPFWSLISAGRVKYEQLSIPMLQRGQPVAGYSRGPTHCDFR
jgi:hypothetical protein